MPSSYLFLWEEWLLGWQEVLAGGGGWGRATSGRGQLGSDRLWDPQEMCLWRGMQLALCCRVRGRTGGPGMGKQRESELSFCECMFTLKIHVPSPFEIFLLTLPYHPFTALFLVKISLKQQQKSVNSLFPVNSLIIAHTPPSRHR